MLLTSLAIAFSCGVVLSQAFIYVSPWLTAGNAVLCFCPPHSRLFTIASYPVLLCVLILSPRLTALKEVFSLPTAHAQYV